MNMPGVQPNGLHPNDTGARRDVLTTGQVAKICQVTSKTVSKWIDTGLLPGWKVPGPDGRGDRRVEAGELLTFLEAYELSDALVRLKDLLPGGPPARLELLPSSSQPEFLKLQVPEPQAAVTQVTYKAFDYEDSGYVYFVQPSGAGAIKIGFSFDPATRLVRLQGASPVPLRCLGVLLGGRRHEHQLHVMFRELRISGEWFKPEEPLLSYIARHAISLESLGEDDRPR